MTVAELIAHLQNLDPALPIRVGAYDEPGETWHEAPAETVCHHDGAVHLFTAGD